MTHVVDVRLGLDQVTVFLEVLRDQRARLVPVHARIQPGLDRQRAVPVDHADRLQAVPFADLEVELVVTRRDLQRAGAELEVDAGIGDQRNQPVKAPQRQPDLTAQVRLPAFVVRMDGDRDVGGDRLRPVVAITTPSSSSLPRSSTNG